MSFSQTNTTNPLHIKRIARHEVGLIVHRDTAGRATSFALDRLDLDEHKLPADARIKLMVYTKTREQGLDLNTVAAPRLNTSHSFDIDTGSPFHFRIIVREAGGPKILASCEGLRATEETEEAGRQHLLPVEPSDNLEERLWELRIEDDSEPVLYVNSDEELGMLARMRGDPIFQALILPQAVEQILVELVDHLGDDGGWHGKWNRYLNDRNIDPPENTDEEASCRSWAREVAQRFANENRFLTEVRARLQEIGYDS
jgi:hypothetical protein